MKEIVDLSSCSSHGCVHENGAAGAVCGRCGSLFNRRHVGCRVAKPKLFCCGAVDWRGARDALQHRRLVASFFFGSVVWISRNRGHFPAAAKGVPEKFLAELDEQATLAETAEAIRKVGLLKRVGRSGY